MNAKQIVNKLLEEESVQPQTVPAAPAAKGYYYGVADKLKISAPDYQEAQGTIYFLSPVLTAKLQALADSTGTDISQLSFLEDDDLRKAVSIVRRGKPVSKPVLVSNQSGQSDCWAHDPTGVTGEDFGDIKNAVPGLINIDPDRAEFETYDYSDKFPELDHYGNWAPGKSPQELGWTPPAEKGDEWTLSDGESDE